MSLRVATRFVALSVLAGSFARSAGADPQVAPPSTAQPATPPGAAARSEIDSGKLMATTVATVGGTPISLRELQDAVWEWQRTYLPKGQKLPPEQLNELAQRLLESLIDRQLYIQEAKRRFLKSDKQRQMFEDLANKQWKQYELPRLIRKHKVANEFELREKLERQGGSLELMRQNYLAETLAREFVQSQLKARVGEPSQPEYVAYYRDHLDEFYRPAQVTWREIVVKVPPGSDRAAARRQAEALLDRLRRGEDFATLARTASQGPTAAKGGLWQTEPNASSIPAVNAALASSPLHAITPILEGPSSFHIVRVEARRAAAPLPFDDEEGIVQRTIREKLREAAFQRELEAFTRQLRAQTIISYQFAHPNNHRDPKTQRASTASGSGR
jgi:parvulin-like peptidyl-prolyl isomerase